MNTLRSLTFALLPLFAVALSTGCASDETDDEESLSGGSTNDAYEYVVDCPSGAGGTITIFPGTTACQNAAEYYAETYSCNDVDNFADADQAICDACGDNSPIPCP